MVTILDQCFPALTLHLYRHSIMGKMFYTYMDTYIHTQVYNRLPSPFTENIFLKINNTTTYMK